MGFGAARHGWCCQCMLQLVMKLLWTYQTYHKITLDIIRHHKTYASHRRVRLVMSRTLERVSSLWLLWLSVSSHWRLSMCKARWLSLRLQFNGTILVSSATVLPISGASVGKWRVRRRFASVETSQTNHAFSKSSKSKHLQMILRYIYIIIYKIYLIYIYLYSVHSKWIYRIYL